MFLLSLFLVGLLFGLCPYLKNKQIKLKQCLQYFTVSQFSEILAFGADPWRLFLPAPRCKMEVDHGWLGCGLTANLRAALETLTDHHFPLQEESSHNLGLGGHLTFKCIP